MKIILFDLPNNWANLLPFTFTKPISDIRIGIYTMKERWQKIFPECEVIPLTADYLNNHTILDIDDEMLFINSALLPDSKTINQIKKLEIYKGIQQNNQLIAYKGFIKYQETSVQFPFAELKFFIHSQNPHYQKALLQSESIHSEAKCLQFPYQVFLWNEKMIEFDFETFVTNLPQGLLGTSNKLIGSEKKLYISPKAKVEGSIINTNTGYVFIDDNAEVMEGSLIRGPLALCQSATLKMGSKIYGATTIGPHCKVGGEVNNSIFFSFSNKAHDGFIGNSVIGEWCNLGADTNNSNLKNNYGKVKIYNYVEDKLVNTGLQFCGLMMGDHSKSGINTMFNTGTVVGVAANVFNSGFPPKHIPSFTWGGAQHIEEYDIDKMFETASEMYKRRNMEFTEIEKTILMKVMEMTAYHRNKIKKS
ncbi:MAG: putative sugar nucleotidyl transferase [Bacteroidia bacterium]|nr:putative sugar nucleotidyl transferase [Bacteroidia bacterium]